MAIVSGFQSGGSGDIKLITPPTIVNEETYLYDGTAKGPTMTNVDTEHITITGTTSASEIGNYTITISLKDPFKMKWNSEGYSNNPIIINYGIIAPIYGVEWDGSSSPAWTRTDGANEFIDPNPYYSGMSDTPSSPFDTIPPWKDMRIVEDNDLGTLVEIPKFWYKWTINGDAMKLQISLIPQEGFSTSPAHADRGDGEGERDYVYVGRYHCDTNYKSTTGVKPIVSIKKSNGRNSITYKKNGAYQYDYAMLWTIRMLYLVEFANWDSQAKIGYGGNNSSSAGNMGYTDYMPYHTGTTQSSRTTSGLGTQYRYIEGLWDNIYDWCEGLYTYGNGKDVYAINNPKDFSDSSNGKKITTYSSSSTGNIASWTIPNTAGLEWALYPKTVVQDSNFNTYSTDYYQHENSSGQTSIYLGVYVGGGYYANKSIGMFCQRKVMPASYTDSTVGCRLMYLPPNS